MASISPPPHVPQACVLLTTRNARESAHELATHLEITRRLARIRGIGFAGICAAPDRPDSGYFVPIDTMLASEAAEFGIRDEGDLFGGVVPRGFAATKAITHPLVSADAVRPVGWSEQFPRRVAEVALAGFAAFSRGDAEIAMTRLLELGDVRIKPVMAKGGLGQVVARRAGDLREIPDDVLASGVVLEENLTDASTYSVGQVSVADLVMSYHGTQRLTKDNRGGEAYGGSDLTVVRGDLGALSRLDLPGRIQKAVSQAHAYDAAADACFPGFFASRRNYDVVQGWDRRGTIRSGVLEQSWRIGGASTAEIVALEAFHADPELRAVRAASVEMYGNEARTPAAAQVFYRGCDPGAGPILKFATLEPL